MPNCCSFQSLHRFIRASDELKRGDEVSSYWVKVYFQEQAIKILPSCGCIDWRKALDLENLEYMNMGLRAINNKSHGKSHMENVISTSLSKADRLFESGVAFEQAANLYQMSSILIQSTTLFGPLSEENLQKYHYAKYKSSYIKACLLASRTPFQRDPAENNGWGQVRDEWAVGI